MAWVDAGLDRGVLNFTIDSDGRVFSVSEYTLAQLGYGRDELVGQQADHLMVLEKPLVRDLMQARGCPGDKRFSPCSLWARDERLFRVLATFWWNANLSTWDFSADIVSIVPAPEPNTEPEQLPNVSQFARAMTVQFQPKLALVRGHVEVECEPARVRVAEAHRGSRRRDRPQARGGAAASA
jgi:hypothetical protein